MRHIYRAYECVAVCVEGGPVTRAEHLLMGEIIKHVHVRGKDGTDDIEGANIEIKYFTFDDLRAELSPYHAKEPAVRRGPAVKSHTRGLAGFTKTKLKNVNMALRPARATTAMDACGGSELVFTRANGRTGSIRSTRFDFDMSNEPAGPPPEAE